jgi:bifunctional NMN adenylyltransferase/nudix hydrolase
MNTFDYAILIGRFQPFHRGHEFLFKHAASIAKHVVVLVGSHNSPVSIRNPWNSSLREHYIRLALKDLDESTYTIDSISDSAYNFNDWIIRVQQKVTAITGKSSRIAIVGHYKDDTSYYLSYFPQWKLEILPTQAGGISSTEIRTACFEGKLHEVRNLLSDQIYTELESWISSDHYKQLLEEYMFIKAYRKRWEDAPFPPTFVTADPVVMALGHILIIKRYINPGKGRYALPGGFIKSTESIEHSCLRELKEQTDLQIGYKELRGSIKLNHVFDHPTRDPRGRVITHAFMFELNVKELPRIKSFDDNAAEVFWCPLYRLEELEPNFFSDHAQIIKFFVNRMH